MYAKEIINILIDIESNIDVNRITYRNIFAWPYIRNQLAIYLIHRNDDYLPRLHGGTLSGKITATLKRLARHTKFLIKNRRHQKIGRSDILFLAHVLHDCFSQQRQ